MKLLRVILRRRGKFPRHDWQEGACPVCRAWHSHPEDCMAYVGPWYRRGK